MKAKVLHDEGNTSFDLKKYEEALNCYEEALEIKPDYHEAWYNRGNALEERAKTVASHTKYIGSCHRGQFSKMW